MYLLSGSTRISLGIRLDKTAADQLAIRPPSRGPLAAAAKAVPKAAVGRATRAASNPAWRWQRPSADAPEQAVGAGGLVTAPLAIVSRAGACCVYKRVCVQATARVVGHGKVNLYYTYGRRRALISGSGPSLMAFPPFLAPPALTRSCVLLSQH